MCADLINHVNCLTAHTSDVPLEIFLKFNKINRLVKTVEEIAKAVKKSELLQLSDDGLKVQRLSPVKLRENEDDCTLYVVCIVITCSFARCSDHSFSFFSRIVHICFLICSLSSHRKIYHRKLPMMCSKRYFHNLAMLYMYQSLSIATPMLLRGLLLWSLTLLKKQ